MFLILVVIIIVASSISSATLHDRDGESGRSAILKSMGAASGAHEDFMTTV